MTRRGITTSDQAVLSNKQHTTPCHDCPMRRDALPGWLGDSTPEEYRLLCHSDAVVDCHTMKGPQCAGVAIYRANVVKRCDPPVLKLPADRKAVFATPTGFIDWHTDRARSFKTLAERRKSMDRACSTLQRETGV